MDPDAKHIALIRDHKDGTETTPWIPWIRTEQENDPDFRRIIRRNDDLFVLRDDLYRWRNDNGEEKIHIPDRIRHQLLRKIHKFLLHFGTDKVIGFAERYFNMENLTRIARDAVASYKI